MIRVFFPDGSHEDRDDASPCIADIFEPKLRHPSEERWYLHFPDEPIPFSFCACGVRPISRWRGGVLVWRITGGMGPGEALTGKWQSCRVEATEEQIDRLTAERDRARRLCLYYCSSNGPLEEWKAMRKQAREEGWLP